MRYYLIRGLVKNLAGKLPLWWSKDQNGLYRCCVIGNSKMKPDSVQFSLRENKKKLECSLMIWGDERRKKEIVEKINNEIIFDHPGAFCFLEYQELEIKNKKYVFDIYIWTESSQKPSYKPVVMLLKA